MNDLEGRGFTVRESGKKERFYPAALSLNLCYSSCKDCLHPTLLQMHWSPPNHSFRTSCQDGLSSVMSSGCDIKQNAQVCQGGDILRLAFIPASPLQGPPATSLNLSHLSIWFMPFLLSLSPVPLQGRWVRSLKIFQSSIWTFPCPIIILSYNCTIYQRWSWSKRIDTFQNHL